MVYANAWKRAHGATATITPTGLGAPSPQTFDDATIIGIPGDEIELVEKTSLGAARKEWDPGDQVDSPEIQIRSSFTGAVSLAGQENAEIEITLPKASATIDIVGHIVSDLPEPAEVGGLLERVITIKPQGDGET